MDYMEDENDLSDAPNISFETTDEQFSQEKVAFINISDTKDQEVFSTVSSLKRQNSDLSDSRVSKKQLTEIYYLTEMSNKKEDFEALQIIDEKFPQEKVTYSNTSDTKDQELFSTVSSLKRQDSDLSDSRVSKKQLTEVYYLTEMSSKKDVEAFQIIDEKFPQEKVTYSHMSDTKDQEVFSSIPSLKRQNSDLSDRSVSKKQRPNVSISEINNEKENVDEILNLVKELCTQIKISPDSCGTIVVDDMDDRSKDKVIQQNFHMGETQQSVSLSEEKSILNKFPNLNFERYADENQICSDSELIPMKCNSSENMEDVPSFDANCNTSSATKILNTDSIEIEGILDIEILSSELSHETETSFDVKQEVDMEEIDSCFETLTTNDQQFKSGQNKEAININVYKEQMENISNEEKRPENEINDCTSNLYSSNINPDMNKTTSSDPIDGKIISSCLYEHSDKLANVISTGCEDTLFQPLRVMADGDLLTFSTHRKDKPTSNCEELLNQTVLVRQNYDFEEEYLSNEDNIKCKENNENNEKRTTYFTYDSDEDSDTFRQQFEEISTKSHSSSSSNMKEFSEQRSSLQGKKVHWSSPKPFTSLIFSTHSKDEPASNCEELLDQTALVGEKCGFEEESLSSKENIKCKENDEKRTTYFTYNSDEDSDTFPQQCEEISSTGHSSGSSNMKEFSGKRSSLLGKKLRISSSNPSTSNEESNLTYEVILAFLENQRQAFTLRELANVIIEEFHPALSYFDAIHSSRIFLRSAMNAGMLKMYNGKYIIISSVVRME